MANKREQAIEKTKKLLSLAGNNPSQAEATAAALKAQALIAHFDIGDYELSDVDEMPINVESRIGQHKNWRFSLADAVADNFRCKYYARTSWHTVQHYWSGRKTRRVDERNVVFFGFRLDAEAAMLTYEHLYKVGNRLANRAAKKAREDLGCADGVYNGFVYGFVEGVREELEVQAQALMIVVPPRVKDAFNGIEWSTDAPKIANRRQWLDVSAREDGKAAGRDAVRAGRIGKGGDHLLAVGR